MQRNGFLDNKFWSWILLKDDKAIHTYIRPNIRPLIFMDDICKERRENVLVRVFRLHQSVMTHISMQSVHFEWWLFLNVVINLASRGTGGVSQIDIIML